MFRSCRGLKGLVSGIVGLVEPCWSVAWWIGYEERAGYGCLILVEKTGL